MEIVCMRVNRTCWQVEKIRKVMQVIFHMLNNGYQVFAVGWIQPDGTSIFSGPQHCHSHHIVIPANGNPEKVTSFPRWFIPGNRDGQES